MAVDESLERSISLQNVHLFLDRGSVERDVVSQEVRRVSVAREDGVSDPPSDLDRVLFPLHGQQVVLRLHFIVYNYINLPEWPSGNNPSPG